MDTLDATGNLTT